MFAKYVYNSGVQATVQADILADVLAIVTGQTNVSSLSASCDKTATTILSTVPAGWLLHDAAAGTNAKAIKSPLADDAASFKQVVIDTNANGSILTKVYESWNATTHAGTNLAFQSDTAAQSQQFSTTTGGIIYIFATPRYLLLASKMGNTWGSASYVGPSGCFERTRFCPSDTVAAGWPPVVFADLGYIMASGKASTPRKMERTGAAILGSSATLDLLIGPYGPVSGLGSLLKGQSRKVLNASGQSIIPNFPVLVSDTNYAAISIPYGSLTELCGLWCVPGGVLGNLETIQISGLDYLCLQAGSTDNLAFLIRKG